MIEPSNDDISPLALSNYSNININANNMVNEGGGGGNESPDQHKKFFAKSNQNKWNQVSFNRLNGVK